MKIVFDFWGTRIIYDGPPTEPPILGDQIATQGTKTHPPVQGSVKSVLPTIDGYLVTLVPLKKGARRARHD